MSSTLDKRAAIVQRLSEINSAMLDLVDHPHGIPPQNVNSWIDLYKERQALEAQLIDVDPV